MRNVFLFILRYSVFLLFLFLQVLSVYLIMSYNKYHEAVGSATLNEITGRINERYNSAEYYFQLRQTNEKLADDNERLRNLLAENFTATDTLSETRVDTIRLDTTQLRRKWMYQRAKVVFNSVTAPNNYIVLGRGSLGNIRKDAGVVDPTNGVVGIVTEVTDNYAVVMSLLHKDSKISAKLKKGGDAGQIVWDGKVPNILTLTDIRKSANVKKGDTVLTSGFTTTFPYGMFLGTVEEVVPEKSTNNYQIKVKSAANFYNLQYGYAIDNLEKDEIQAILNRAKAKLNN